MRNGWLLPRPLRSVLRNLSLYPRISINGNLLLEAAELGDLFDARSWAGTIGSGFRWNVLNYGRILNNVRVQVWGIPATGGRLSTADGAPGQRSQ